MPRNCNECGEMTEDDNFSTGQRINKCLGCAKKRNIQSYIKGKKLTKSMCDTPELLSKWKDMKDIRDTRRDKRGLYTCEVCNKSVLKTTEQIHLGSKYHNTRVKIANGEINICNKEPKKRGRPKLPEDQKNNRKCIIKKIYTPSEYEITPDMHERIMKIINDAGVKGKKNNDELNAPNN